jgi:hypothetical protein
LAKTEEEGAALGPLGQMMEMSAASTPREDEYLAYSYEDRTAMKGHAAERRRMDLDARPSLPKSSPKQFR